MRRPIENLRAIGMAAARNLSLRWHFRVGLSDSLRHAVCFVGGASRSANLGGDGLGEAVGRFGSAQVAGANALAQQVERGVLDRLADRDLAELVEQQRQRQEDGRRVGQVLAGDIGGRSVGGVEEGDPHDGRRVEGQVGTGADARASRPGRRPCPRGNRRTRSRPARSGTSRAP